MFGSKCLSPFVIGVVVLLGGALGLSILVGLSSVVILAPSEFAVVVDAGSSHSEFLVYTWHPSKANISTRVYEAPKVEQVKFSCSTDKGISMYDDPRDSAASLQDCLTQAASVIPANRRSQTPVHLRATAGMRVLHENNPAKADAILNACLALFLDSGLNGTTSSAEILPGSLEGGFGWITANYIQETILSKHSGKNTLGALDLGGASTQITFNDPSTFDSLSPQDKLRMQLFGHEYFVYTHSYLCYGLNAARQRLQTLALSHLDTRREEAGFGEVKQGVVDLGRAVVPNPCLPKGYSVNLTADDVTTLRTDFCSRGVAFNESIVAVTFVGTSDSDECQTLAEALVEDGQPPPRMGTGQPPVPTQQFFAFSGYYYLVDFLCSSRGVPECEPGKNNGWVLSPSGLRAATSRLCAETAAKLRDDTPSVPDKYLMDYCYQGHYVASVLTSGYEFAHDTTQIEFVKDVDGKDVGWTLGYLLYDATLESGAGTSHVVPMAGLLAGIVVSGLLLVFGVLLLYRAFKSHRSEYVRLN